MFYEPWMVADHLVSVAKWHPFFDPYDVQVTNITAWVLFPGLPIEYYNATALMKPGNLVRRALYVDNTTLSATRGKYARVCAEIDLSKPLLAKYKLKLRVHKIEYEGLHNTCFSCGIYGHNMEACPKQESELNPNLGGAERISAQPIVNTITRPEVLDDFGPWMVAKRNCRKKSNFPVRNKSENQSVSGANGAQRKGGTIIEPNAKATGKIGDGVTEVSGGSRYTILRVEGEQEIEVRDRVLERGKTSFVLNQENGPHLSEKRQKSLNGPENKLKTLNGPKDRTNSKSQINNAARLVKESTRGLILTEKQPMKLQPKGSETEEITEVESIQKPLQTNESHRNSIFNSRTP